MKNSNSSRWLMIASLAITGMALNVGCSSGTSTPADSGTGSGGSNTAAGRHTGTGGSNTGTGGATVTHVAPLPYTFDTTVQGWSLSTYADPAGHNLAGIYPAPDGGADAGCRGRRRGDGRPPR